MMKKGITVSDDTCEALEEIIRRAEGELYKLT
jgi:hypothetical protein